MAKEKFNHQKWQRENTINEGGMSQIRRHRSFQRMEGLHNLKHMKTMLNAASLLFQDMEEEGFEGIEIYDFLMYKINKTNL